jgi:hypothetical protein
MRNLLKHRANLGELWLALGWELFDLQSNILRYQGCALVLKSPPREAWDKHWGKKTLEHNFIEKRHTFLIKYTRWRIIKYVKRLGVAIMVHIAVTLPATLVVEVFGADPAAFEVEVSAGPASASGAAVSAASGASFEVALTPAFEAALTAALEAEVFDTAPEVLGLETLVTEGASFAAALTPDFEVVLAAAFDEVVPLLRLPVVGDPPSAPWAWGGDALAASISKHPVGRTACIDADPAAAKYMSILGRTFTHRFLLMTSTWAWAVSGPLSTIDCSVSTTAWKVPWVASVSLAAWIMAIWPKAVSRMVLWLSSSISALSAIVAWRVNSSPVKEVAVLRNLVTLAVSFIQEMTAFATCLSLTPFVAPPALPAVALLAAVDVLLAAVALLVLAALPPLTDELAAAAGAAKPRPAHRAKRTNIGIGSSITTNFFYEGEVYRKTMKDSGYEAPFKGGSLSKRKIMRKAEEGV